MFPLKQLLLILTPVALLVGCGESKEALEPSVTPKATPEKETRNPELPKADVKKPLTEEESAKIIEASIRKELKKPTGELTKADFEKVTELELIGRNLTEVKGLEKLTQLTFLDLTNNKLTDVIGLKNLTQLKEVNLSGNQLTELPKGLEKLTQLKVMSLAGNQLTDVTGLEKLTQLERLYLHYSQLTDVPKGLENLTQITYLHLGENPDLTKAQIDQLQKAFPKCRITSNPTK